MKNILVIGSINMDMVIQTDRVPKMGETITGSGFETICGGKGANQAIAAAKLGGNVRMIGCVGDDVYGKAMIENLKKNGVDASGIEIKNGASGVAMITVSGGDNFIILDKGANALCDRDVIDKNIDLIKWADIVIMQFEIPQDTVLYAAEKTKEYGGMVVLNPAPMAEINPELLNLVDILVTNESETEQLLNKEFSDYTEAIGEIKNLGIKNPIITLGADGSIYNEGTEIKRQASYPAKAVDTTAAGDCFIGGVCAQLAEGKSLSEAVDFASKASSITVQTKGAAVSIPTKDMVK